MNLELHMSSKECCKMEYRDPFDFVEFFRNKLFDAVDSEERLMSSQSSAAEDGKTMEIS